MKIFDCVNGISPFQNREICAAIQAGAVLIFPTETIYGIGCSALNDTALRRIYQIKGRSFAYPPPVLVGDESQAGRLVAWVPQHARELMEQFWPGALTIILPAREEVSDLLCGVSDDGATRTIGVRLTPHPVARALCQSSDTPLVATSANFSGAQGRAATPQVLDDIPAEFRQQVDIVIDGGAVYGAPSTVVDCSGKTPRVVRQGAVQLSL